MTVSGLQWLMLAYIIVLLVYAAGWLIAALVGEL